MPYAPPTSPYLSRMASAYGVRPGRRSGRPTFHSGLDLRGRTGEPVYAVADGVVDFVAAESQPRRTRGYGNVVSIHHPADGVYSVYAHLHRVFVAEGERVTAGQQIAQVGKTTNRKFPGMGSHLHFELRRPRNGGSPFPGPYRAFNIDPQPWLAARGVEIGYRGIRIEPGTEAVEPALMQPIGGLGGWDWPNDTAGVHGLGRRPSGTAKAIRSLFLGRRTHRLLDVGIAPERLLRATGLTGLGQDPAAEAALDMGAEGLPAEPVADPESFDPVAAGAVIGIAVAGSLIVGVAFLGLREIDWRRVFEGR